ncbi:hypothetical protein FSC37_15120 [Piscinibacter aquaticus]|uniref:Uncharacterized protein n=1 Tax=Piscinibacter aquaticus TaxID=392597 RepID=A0A5C6U3R8_9BURK|nr:hypothetical protein FSC37_15120 [Piscinibacter aquaticus]
MLALEGHGAGYLPEIDRRQLTLASMTDGDPKDFEWRLDASGGAPVLPGGSPLLPGGSPLLPGGSPLLPGGSPLLPANHMPMSTWGLGAALRAAADAGVPRISVIHFDNCFNMSVEVLHTVAPYAEYATGYPNYNFFTAGEGYPGVFATLAQQGATARDLAQAFAKGNQKILEDKRNHPTIGCAIRLERMKDITERLDDWPMRCSRHCARRRRARRRGSRWCRPSPRPFSRRSSTTPKPATCSRRRISSPTSPASPARC